MGETFDNYYKCQMYRGAAAEVCDVTVLFLAMPG